MAAKATSIIVAASVSASPIQEESYRFGITATVIPMIWAEFGVPIVMVLLPSSLEIAEGVP
jgi:hypothetical protein